MEEDNKHYEIKDINNDLTKLNNIKEEHYNPSDRESRPNVVPTGQSIHRDDINNNNENED